MKAKILLALLALTVFSAEADVPCEAEWNSTAKSQVKEHIKLIYKIESKEEGSTVEYLPDLSEEDVDLLFDVKNGLRTDRFPTAGEEHVFPKYNDKGDFTGSTSRQKLISGDKVVVLKVNNTKYPVAVIRDCIYIPVMDGVSNTPAPAPKETSRKTKEDLEKENEKLREKLAFTEKDEDDDDDVATTATRGKDGNINIKVEIHNSGDATATAGGKGSGGGSGEGEDKYIILYENGDYVELSEDQAQSIIHAQPQRKWRFGTGGGNNVRYLASNNSAFVSYKQQAGCTYCGPPLTRTGRPLSSPAEIATAVGVWTQPVLQPLYFRMWDALLGGATSGGSLGRGRYNFDGNGGGGGNTGGGAWTGATHRRAF